MRDHGKTETFAFVFLVILAGLFIVGLISQEAIQRELEHKIDKCIIQTEPRPEIKDYCEAIVKLQWRLDNEE